MREMYKRIAQQKPTEGNSIKSSKYFTRKIDFFVTRQKAEYEIFKK